MALAAVLEFKAVATPSPKLELVRPDQYPARAFVVQMRGIPIEDLPWWAQWMLRFVWKHCAWAFSTYDGKNYYNVHGQAICTTEEQAKELAKRPGWFYKELPVNIALPDETVNFGKQVYPAASKPLPAINAPQARETVKRSDVVAVYQQARNLNERLKATAL